MNTQSTYLVNQDRFEEYSEQGKTGCGSLAGRLAGYNGLGRSNVEAVRENSKYW
jgi:hypothetical protein